MKYRVGDEVLNQMSVVIRVNGVEQDYVVEADTTWGFVRKFVRRNGFFVMNAACDGNKIEWVFGRVTAELTPMEEK